MPLPTRLRARLPFSVGSYLYSHFQGFFWTGSPWSGATDQVGRASQDGTRCQLAVILSLVFNRTLIFEVAVCPVYSLFLDLQPPLQKTKKHSLNSLLGEVWVKCTIFCLERIKGWRQSSHGNQTVGRASAAKHHSDNFEKVSPPISMFPELI